MGRGACSPYYCYTGDTACARGESQLDTGDTACARGESQVRHYRKSAIQSVHTHNSNEQLLGRPSLQQPLLFHFLLKLSSPLNIFRDSQLFQLVGPLLVCVCVGGGGGGYHCLWLLYSPLPSPPLPSPPPHLQPLHPASEVLYVASDGHNFLPVQWHFLQLCVCVL